MRGQRSEYALDIEVRSDVVIFAFPGSIDSFETEDLRGTIVAKINECKSLKVIYNFSKVDFIDSSGVGMFINVQNEIEKSFGEKRVKLDARFCHVNKKIYESFDAMNLFTIFALDNTLEESLHYFGV